MDNCERVQKSLWLILFYTGMRQEDLAKKLNLSRQYFSELSNQKKKMSNVIALAILYILYSEYNHVYLALFYDKNTELIDINRIEKANTWLHNVRKQKFSQGYKENYVYDILFN